MAKMVCNRSPGVTHIAMQNHTTQPLTDEEANALRYVAGYVPFSLQKKLRHRPEFSECLKGMGVEGSPEGYLEYTGWRG